jgi:four helix bundle protein
MEEPPRRGSKRRRRRAVGVTGRGDQEVGKYTACDVHRSMVADVDTGSPVIAAVATTIASDQMNLASSSRILTDSMVQVKSFEELRVWRAAREIVKTIYEITKGTAMLEDFALREQDCRAAGSIPSNIAEGFSRHSNKEFIQFLLEAKGSLAEVQTQLYIALDQQYISQQRFDEIYSELDALAKQISRLITYLKDAS